MTSCVCVCVCDISVWCVCVCVCVLTSVCVCVCGVCGWHQCVCVCADISVCVCVCWHQCVCVCVLTSVWCVCLLTSVCVCVCVCGVCVCWHQCVCVCVVCWHHCVCVCVCVLCVCVLTSVCVCVCVWLCVVCAKYTSSLNGSALIGLNMLCNTHSFHRLLLLLYGDKEQTLLIKYALCCFRIEKKALPIWIVFLKEDVHKDTSFKVWICGSVHLCEAVWSVWSTIEVNVTWAFARCDVLITVFISCLLTKS